MAKLALFDNSRLTARMEHGALMYARADNSDPFAYNRAMSHIKSGVASLGPKGEPMFYDARPITEIRKTPEGEEYGVTVYHSRCRP